MITALLLGLWIAVGVVGLAASLAMTLHPRHHARALQLLDTCLAVWIIGGLTVLGLGGQL